MTRVYYRVRIYVGPVHVREYTHEASMRGLLNAWPGTEHVYGGLPAPKLESEGDRQVFRQRATDLVYGTPMAAGWRDCDILGGES